MVAAGNRKSELMTTNQLAPGRAAVDVRMNACFASQDVSPSATTGASGDRQKYTDSSATAKTPSQPATNCINASRTSVSLSCDTRK